jgi:hypothetical protein
MQSYGRKFLAPLRGWGLGTLFTTQLTLWALFWRRSVAEVRE